MLVKVKAAILREAFDQLAVIYKSSEEYRAFNMRYAKGKLTLTSSTGVKYVCTLDATSDEDDALDVNLLFRDVGELLPGRGDMLIELTPMYATLKTAYVDLTLQQANEIVTPYTAALSMDTKPINAEDIIDTIKCLTSTAAFKKAYKLDPLLTLNTSGCLVKFPTVWIHKSGLQIATNITPDDAMVLCKFEPTKVRERENDFVFFNDNAILILQKVTPSIDNFRELSKGCNKVCSLTQEGLIATLRKLLKILGPGMCDIYFCAEGIRMRILRAGANSMFTFGNADKVAATAKLPLEFVLQMFSIVGEQDVTISSGGGKLCLTSGTTSILTSVSD